MRQAWLNDAKFTHIAIDTSEVLQIDIDGADYTVEEVRTLVETAPYYLSATKKLPHIFVRTTEPLPLDRTSLDNDNVEVLNRSFSYAPKDAVMQRVSEIPVSELSFARKKAPQSKGAVKQTRKKTTAPVPESAAPRKQVEDLLNCLSDDRASLYDDWWRVGVALHSWSPTDGFGLWQQFSARCPEKYKATDWHEGGLAHRVWASTQTGEITLGSLHYWAKEDNPRYTSLLQPTYEQVKREFEKTHFKLMTPYVFCTEAGDELVTQKERDFLGAYNNLYYYSTDDAGKVQRHPFVRVWLQDVNLRTYTKLDFLPSAPVTCTTPLQD
jgi:hypothetical protein